MKLLKNLLDLNKNCKFININELKTPNLKMPDQIIISLIKSAASSSYKKLKKLMCELYNIFQRCQRILVQNKSCKSIFLSRPRHQNCLVQGTLHRRRI